MVAEFTACGVLFAVVTWLIGLSFHAGRMSERVNHQDDWRKEHLAEHAAWSMERRDDVRRIYEKIDNLWGDKFRPERE